MIYHLTREKADFDMLGIPSKAEGFESYCIFLHPLNLCAISSWVQFKKQGSYVRVKLWNPMCEMISLNISEWMRHIPGGKTLRQERM